MKCFKAEKWSKYNLEEKMEYNKITNEGRHNINIIITVKQDANKNIPRCMIEGSKTLNPFIQL
jgi:hypothetical protein